MQNKTKLMHEKDLQLKVNKLLYKEESEISEKSGSDSIFKEKGEKVE